MLYFCVPVKRSWNNGGILISDGLIKVKLIDSKNFYIKCVETASEFHNEGRISKMRADMFRRFIASRSSLVKRFQEWETSCLRSSVLWPAYFSIFWNILANVLQFLLLRIGVQKENISFIPLKLSYLNVNYILFLTWRSNSFFISKNDIILTHFSPVLSFI